VIRGEGHASSRGWACSLKRKKILEGREVEREEKERAFSFSKESKAVFVRGKRLEERWGKVHSGLPRGKEMDSFFS